MSKLFNYSEIHIELSSKCTLKCPRCPRTELHPDGLNKEFSLSEFKQAFPTDVLASVNKLIFCGDMGDPIYASDFLKIIEYIKQTNNLLQIVIVTNGSYKKVDWWTTLGNLLSFNDIIKFSVDGWDNESNNIYRVNSNFDSIVEGIKTIRATSDCKIIWSAIYFQFNEDYMDRLKNLAAQLGCDEFQSVYSTKFDGRYLLNGVDSLKPVNKNNISDSSLYRADIIPLNNKVRPVYLKKAAIEKHQWARCLRWEKELFINAEGLIFPCPWFNSGYQQNDFVRKYSQKLNVKTRDLAEVLSDPIWEEFSARLNSSPLDICKIKCKDECR